MVIIAVFPFSLTTNGGFTVQVTGIYPGSRDCIIGTLFAPNGTQQSGSWDLNGLMRGGNDACNLNPRTNEMIELGIIARRLGCDG